MRIRTYFNIMKWTSSHIQGLNQKSALSIPNNEYIRATLIIFDTYTHYLPHTTYVVYTNFIHKRRELQFKLTPNDRFFLRNLSGGNRRRKNFCIFLCLVWGSVADFTSNKPKHCILYYGVFSAAYTRQLFNCSLEYLWVAKKKKTIHC